MTDAEFDEFYNFYKLVRKRSNYSYFARFEEEQDEAIKKNVLVDVESDSPIPRWARAILVTPGISKKLRLLLMYYWDNKIREQRIKKAKGL